MIKPIATVHNGYKFRSRLEARWAVFFDTIGIEYEPEGCELNNKMCAYLTSLYLAARQARFEHEQIRKETNV